MLGRVARLGWTAAAGLRQSPPLKALPLPLCHRHLHPGLGLSNNSARCFSADTTLPPEMSYQQVGSRKTLRVRFYLDMIQLTTVLREKTATVIDVRSEAEVAEQGGIPGALNIPLPDLAEALAMRPRKAVLS